MKVGSVLAAPGIYLPLHLVSTGGTKRCDSTGDFKTVDNFSGQFSLTLQIGVMLYVTDPRDGKYPLRDKADAW